MSRRLHSISVPALEHVEPESCWPFSKEGYPKTEYIVRYLDPSTSSLRTPSIRVYTDANEQLFLKSKLTFCNLNNGEAGTPPTHTQKKRRKSC